MSDLIEYVFGTGDGAPSRWRSSADWDVSGDGRPDAVRLDFDGDGRRDDVLWDVDGDGVADRAGLDRDDNGVPEHWYVDRDGSGVWGTPVTGDPHLPAAPRSPVASLPQPAPTPQPAPPSPPIREWPPTPPTPSPAQGGLVWSGLDGTEHRQPNPVTDAVGPHGGADLDGDGSADDEVYDTDRDGRADVGLLTGGRGGGVLANDRLYLDVDRDGRFDQVLADMNGDGRLDRVFAAADPEFRTRD
ncbi:hypothetical protein [Jongsikchunia kroppenstedtii]|uniref:hypothetical protein n=1 Tax=Jongsikchunia kroppenstedtii TaxID=1121721 RepID=UPI0003A40FFF|nr:hypothetical protein [Jongsikchunia kroppenstedtii]